MGRQTPRPIARQLRQEAGFGCARCGHPYIEYHHIIPYAEEQHYRAEDMVALCGNCHPSVAKMGSDRQYQIKATPHNKRNGKFQGALEYDKRDLIFKLGGCIFKNTTTLIQVGEISLVKCKIDEGQAKISLNLRNDKNQKLLCITDNEITFRTEDIWDFRYQHNFVTVHSARNNINLSIDFREEPATLSGCFWAYGKKYECSKNYILFGHETFFRDLHISGEDVGILFEVDSTTAS